MRFLAVTASGRSLQDAVSQASRVDRRNDCLFRTIFAGDRVALRLP